MDDTTARWMAITAIRPEATVCLLSALAWHGLVDEIPRSTHIAIPQGTHPVVVGRWPITWHRFPADTFSLGRNELAVPEGIAVGVYSAERTIIDVFRLWRDRGDDIAIRALERWVRTSGNQPGALLALARSFPDARPSVQSALETLL